MRWKAPLATGSVDVPFRVGSHVALLVEITWDGQTLQGRSCQVTSMGMVLELEADLPDSTVVTLCFQGGREHPTNVLGVVHGKTLSANSRRQYSIRFVEIL